MPQPRKDPVIDQSSDDVAGSAQESISWKEPKKWLPWIRSALEFQWIHRRRTWRRLLEYVRTRDDWPNRRRELRLFSDHIYEHATANNGDWQVQLPDCCIHCGGENDLSPFKQVKRVQDMTLPFWALVIAAVSGISMWFSTSSMLLFLAFLILGCGVGYYLRNESRVTIQGQRCSRHDGMNTYPQVWVHGNELIILCGEDSVRRRFENPRSEVPHPQPRSRKRKPVAAEQSASVAARIPQPTIPLAVDSTQGNSPETPVAGALTTARMIEPLTPAVEPVHLPKTLPPIPVVENPISTVQKSSDIPIAGAPAAGHFLQVGTPGKTIRETTGGYTLAPPSEVDRAPVELPDEEEKRPAGALGVLAAGLVFAAVAAEIGFVGAKLELIPVAAPLAAKVGSGIGGAIGIFIGSIGWIAGSRR